MNAGGERITNEELVKRIKEGDKEAVLQLWEQVKKFVAMKAREKMNFSRQCPSVDYDDLMQEGYLAMLDTVKYFDTSKSYSFVSCLAYSVLNRFQDATGWLRGPGRNNPTKVSVASLNVPVNEDEDIELVDVIADENAEDPQRSTESRLLRRAIMEAIDTLPAEQQAAIIGHFFYDLPLDSLDKKQYEKALRALRKSEISNKLRGFL